MYFDTDLGMERISGIHTALELDQNAWTTFCVMALRRHSNIVALA